MGFNPCTKQNDDNSLHTTEIYKKTQRTASRRLRERQHGRRLDRSPPVSQSAKLVSDDNETIESTTTTHGHAALAATILPT